MPVNGYYSKGPLPDAKQFEVLAGKEGFISVQAEKGKKLSWTFQTDGHFAYAVFFSPDSNSEDITTMKPVYPRFNVSQTVKNRILLNLFSESSWPYSCAIK